MSAVARMHFSLGALLLIALPLEAQVVLEDRPRPFVPLRPESKAQKDRREALKLYALGLLCERDDRLLEALRTYEKAAALDPDAAPVLRAQIPLYLALDRATESLAATKKVLELDPDDYETWYVYARQLRGLGQPNEAREALLHALACSEVKAHPEAAQQIYTELGTIYESTEEWLKAAEALTSAVKILDHPEALEEIGPVSRERILIRAGETYERIGRIYLKAGRPTEAVAAYRKAQERFPDGARRLNYNLAQVCRQQSQWQQALTYLDAYLSLQPQGTEPYEMKIGLLDRLGRDAEALPWLEQASQADPHNLGLKLLLARQYVRGGRTAPAERLFFEIGGAAPSAEVYRELFHLYRDDPRKGTEEAVSLFNRVLDKAEKKEGAASVTAAAQAKAILAALRQDDALAKDLVRAALTQVERTSLRPQTLYFLAVLADRNRQPDEAEGLFRHCLRDLSPDNQAAVYGGLLRTLWKARKYEAMVTVCQEGLRRAKGSARLLFHNDLAKAYAALGRMDHALAEADHALALADGQRQLPMRLLRVRLLTIGERFDQAETECLKLLEEFTGPGEGLEIRSLLSGVYSAARNYAKAEAQLGLLLKADPNNATANNDLGYLWAEQGKNLAEAEALIRKALELDRRNRKSPLGPQSEEDDRDNAAYIDSLGWVLFRRGQVEEAREQLEKAVALPDGDDPAIWDHLGDIYQRLGMAEQARNAWRRALTLIERDQRRRSDHRHDDLVRKLKLLDIKSDK
jgi:tetratricopeptide (TPR) repeat protein